LAGLSAAGGDVGPDQDAEPETTACQKRYKPAEQWSDARGRPYRPGVHYVVGGNTKVYGASLPRFRERDFTAVEHLEGTSPASLGCPPHVRPPPS